jgi:hypothetical protein
MRIARARPASPCFEFRAPFLCIRDLQCFRQAVRPFLVALHVLGVVQKPAEHQPQVVEGRHAGADDGDVVRAEGRECLPHGVVRAGGGGAEDRELHDGDAGGGLDEEEGDEYTVVPAWGGMLVR